MENRKSERKKAKLEQETAGISSDYGAVQLKDRPARHLLGNLFALYAEIKAGVKGQHGKRCTVWFKCIFHSLENRCCETFVLIFASWGISDSLCFSATSIHVSKLSRLEFSHVTSCTLLLSSLMSFLPTCVLAFKSVW